MGGLCSFIAIIIVVAHISGLTYFIIWDPSYDKETEKIFGGENEDSWPLD
jgi:hypothetical protein